MAAELQRGRVADKRPGTSSPRLGVDWYVNNCGAIFYTGHMIVTGPAGVPPF